MTYKKCCNSIEERFKNSLGRNETRETGYRIRGYGKDSPTFAGLWINGVEFTTKRKANSHGNNDRTTKASLDSYSVLQRNALQIADEAVALLIKKHKDYGPSNISDAPGGALNGLSVRLHDKVARLNNLIGSGKEPSNESIRDTFTDILNYAIISLLVIDNKWDKK